jgi:hypothetical protein
MEPSRPDKLTRWQRWRIVFYSFVGIVLFLLLGWGYLKYSEYRDWALFDEMLVEQDKLHHNWRWLEFLPQPLQPGQVNGALRFIEVGKQLTNEMLVSEDIPEEEVVRYPMMTKEWLTIIDNEPQRRNDQKIRERCILLEKELPRLIEILPGSPPFGAQRPSAQAIWGIADDKKKEPPPSKEDVSYAMQSRWLPIITRCFINEGKSQQAVEAWRALLASAISDCPGRISIHARTRGYYRAYHLLYQLLARTTPDEAALCGLQQSVMQWRSHLYTIDDVLMDRAWSVQLLLEMKEQSKGAFLTGLHQLYAKPPKWLPEKWHELASSLGIGSPSLASMYRMELQTHLRLMDFLEERLKAEKPVYGNVGDLMDDPIAMPGRHFNTYFRPRWNKILADVGTMNDDLLCMEAIIAAERYRLKHGDYPRQWSDIVPSLLQAIPQAEGKAFILKPVPEGLVIYLPDEKDLGGIVLRTSNKDTNPFDRQTDQGLMSFYPKHRRQPPPPVISKAESEEP